jgi:hypothetical protein
MSDIYILRYIVKEECEIYKTINFFYLIGGSLNCCTIALSSEEFTKFKSHRNKHKYLQTRILNKEFILDDKIEHLITVDEFIKQHKLERKFRQHQLKKVLKNGVTK